jgi:hypothetical protein
MNQIFLFDFLINSRLQVKDIFLVSARGGFWVEAERRRRGAERERKKEESKVKIKAPPARAKSDRESE